MLTHCVWMNHARKGVQASTKPYPDSHYTGWSHNNAGTSVSPKTGFRDDMDESDFRGHSLDATDRIATGSMYNASDRHPLPIIDYTHRG